MRYSLLLFTLIPFITFSQQKLDFGNIRFDSAELCKDYFINYTSSTCPTDIICDSKNELEIRLTLTCGLVPCLKLYILSFNGKNWDSFLYKRSKEGCDTIKLKAKNSFDSVFLSLKKNRLFMLTDVDDISDNDAASYRVTFKAGDKFRTYQFEDMKFYKDHFPKNEFNYYLKIVEIFEKELIPFN